MAAVSVRFSGFVLAAAFAMAPVPARAQATPPSGGPRINELAGGRDRPGLFTQRLILPPHFCGPVHTHNQDLHGLVLRGTLRFGVVDTLGRLEVRDYPAGSFVPIAAGRQHVEGSVEETEIHLSGIGPLRTTVTDSTRRCDQTPDR
jgi:quercetin dioxygenase-like cupin family protein